MFDQYPKIRTKLPEELEKIYKYQYKSNREGNTTASGIAQKMEAWLHRKVAADVKGKHAFRTLEIGAGTLNQLKFEDPEHYDIVEPFKELFADSPLKAKLSNIYSDIEEISYSQRYDRITSIATFEHILNLPEVVAKTCLLLEQGGSLRTSIPNEGTFLWTLGWKLTTGMEFRIKYGMDYGILMRHEHVNTASEIEQVLHYFYKINKCSTFGLSRGIALYRFYESREPRVDLAREYLNLKS